MGLIIQGAIAIGQQYILAGTGMTGSPVSGGHQQITLEMMDDTRLATYNSHTNI